MRRFDAFAVIILIAACSQDELEQPPIAEEGTGEVVPLEEQPSPDRAIPLLTAEGFGPHAVGQPIALVGPFPPREAERTSQDCRLYSDANLPGVWIMTDGDGVVQRVSVGGNSTLVTAQGITLGTSQAAVFAAYPTARGEPHEYIIGGSNLYTTAPGSAGLRFEIGATGTVVEMHGGTQPFLGYSEGCA